MSKASEEYVKSCTALDSKRDAGLLTPENVERQDDILYGEAGKWHTLDVYRPKYTEGEKLPLIVSVHGGGWVYGTKETYQFYCMSLAQRGFAVINFNYRLAPEGKFPAALEDTCAVFGWANEHAEEYGFDMKRVFAVGDSVGAEITAMFACMQKNREYAARFAFSAPEGIALRALGLNCGVYDMHAGLMRRICFKEDLFENGEAGNAFDTMSPSLFITPDIPPCYIMTSNADFLRRESKRLCRVLRRAGVEHEYKRYGDRKNVLYHVFHCNVRNETAKQANDDECAFFRRHM